MRRSIPLSNAITTLEVVEKPKATKMEARSHLTNLNLLTSWDLNLRGNLRLWPRISPNIVGLASCIGRKYDEAEFVSELSNTEGEGRKDPRAVRNTFEVLAQSGLVFRDREDFLRATDLGANLFSFLGAGRAQHSFANVQNIGLLAPYLVRALSLIIECRVVWRLMRLCDNSLSNEELNRAAAAIHCFGDIDEVAAKVRHARDVGDVTEVGPRAYEESKFGTAQENDQRKAMNPQFLLAGGGGIFIGVSAGDPMRVLDESVVRFVDRAICTQRYSDVHASADSALSLKMSRVSLA